MLAVCTRDTREFTNLSTTYLMTSLFLCFFLNFFLKTSSWENYVPLICWIRQMLSSNTPKPNVGYFSGFFWISPGNWSRHVVPLAILLIITLMYFLKYESVSKGLDIMLGFLMWKFCWQFSSLSVAGIISVSLLKFVMSTWYHIVLYKVTVSSDS